VATIKPPTASELAVMAFGASAALIVLGLVGLAYGFFAPPEKREIAVALTYYGGGSLGLGVLIALATWAVRRFTD
jgi:hypothetical protein